MAKQIVGYMLNKEQLRAIHAGADNPGGKLGWRKFKFLKIEKQRKRFIRNHGNPFGCVAQCCGVSCCMTIF